MELTLELVQAAIRLAWKTGDLRHKLKAPQHQAYDQFYAKRESRKFVMVAGRRCRKSTLLLILHAECCIRTPGVQTAYVAPVETGLVDYINPIMDVVFSDCPIDLRPVLRDRTLHYPNGSRTVFNGCNMRQYRYMRGQKLALATVDEMAEVDDLEGAVDDVLFPAVWDSHGEMVLSGTPPVVPSPDHPVVRYVQAAKLSGSYFHATVYDACYTEEEISEACREVGIDGKDSPRFKREFMAEFIRDESAVIVPEFDERRHVENVERPVYYAELYKTSGADLGVADKTVCLFAYYDFPNARIVIQKEFVLKGVEVRTDYFAVQFRAACDELGWSNDSSRVSHWSDNSNLMLLNDLALIHGINIGATEKEQKNEWLNKVKILFHQNRIVVDPSCKLLIATLNGAFWKDPLKKDYGRSVALGHMDALDALIYLVRNMRMESNPFPLNYNLTMGTIYDPATHRYPENWDHLPHTPEGQALRQAFSRHRVSSKHGLAMGGL